jgi:DNA-binding CsgD family transcriptional regulator
MRYLGRRDFHGIMEVVEELYTYDTAEECEVGMLRSLRRVIGCDSFHMSIIDRGLGRARWASSWSLGQPSFNPGITQVFERHMYEHPFMEHWEHRQAAPRSATLSDFVDLSLWHNTALYNEFYRQFSMEQMLGIAVRVSGPSKMHVTAMRETTDFDMRDRRVLDLLVPHLEASYRYCESVSDLKSQLTLLLRGLEVDGGAAIQVDADRRIRHMSAHAQDLLTAYFGTRWVDRSALPPPVDDWLRSHGRAAGFSLRPLQPLVAEGDGRRLTVQFVRSHDGLFLLLSERKLRIAPADIASLGLSPRETEVLAWLAHGKSNAEIAGILGLAPATVKHCLERLYGKLDVNTRAAATAVAVATAGMSG